MRVFFLLMLLALLIAGSTESANASKPITFYYKFVADVGTGTLQSDGIFVGNRKKSSRKQQEDCLRYAKTMVPVNTHIQHLSCTPLAQINDGRVNMAGPWGSTINQFGAIKKLTTEKQKILKRIAVLKREVRKLTTKQTKLLMEAESFAPRLDRYTKRCEKEFIFPKEKAEYDKCVAEYKSIQKIGKSIQDRIQVNNKSMRKRVAEIDTIEQKAKLINWNLNRRLSFQNSANDCFGPSKGKSLDCLRDKWTKLTRGF